MHNCDTEHVGQCVHMRDRRDRRDQNRNMGLGQNNNNNKKNNKKKGGKKTTKELWVDDSINLV